METIEYRQKDRKLSDEATIGARIRAVRRQAGQTLEQFGAAIGYSRRAVITWEQSVGTQRSSFSVKTFGHSHLSFKQWIALRRRLLR